MNGRPCAQASSRSSRRIVARKESLPNDYATGEGASPLFSQDGGSQKLRPVRRVGYGLPADPSFLEGATMIPEVLVFAQVAAIIVFLTGSLAAIGVVTTHAIRRATRQELPSMQQADARLEQLQQSVDSIALEVERIAEAQRFSAKLLAERADTADRPT